MKINNPNNYPVLTEIIGRLSPKFSFEIKHQQNDPEVMALLSEITTNAIPKQAKAAEKEVLFRAETLNEQRELQKFFNLSATPDLVMTTNQTPPTAKVKNPELSKNIFTENQSTTKPKSKKTITSHSLNLDINQYTRIIDDIEELNFNEDNKP